MRKGKLVFIQPIMTSYRMPLFRDLHDRLDGDFSVYSDTPSSDYGVKGIEGFDFNRIEWKKLGPTYWPRVKTFCKMYKEGSTFIHFADYKYFSLWLLLFLCCFSSKKVLLHGQGGYKNNTKIATLVYLVTILLSSGYICYTNYSSKKLKARLPSWLHKKIFVVNNSLYIKPVETATTNEKDILFIGRLRHGSEIELLLNTATSLNQKVHVIGDGANGYINQLIKKHPEHQFYGSIYNWDSQKEIAKECSMAVYPGDAGLSVVTYMALGLPIIVHNDFTCHMGPEPSYIKEFQCGHFFSRGESLSLENCITSLQAQTPANGLSGFAKLSRETMGQGFIRVLDQTHAI